MNSSRFSPMTKLPIRPLALVAFMAGAALLAGCISRGEAAARAERPQARFIKGIDGFYGPESAKYDAEQDVWFVTAMLGPGSKRDGAAYVVRIPAGPLGPPTLFIEGGKNGAVLNAPKGMAIHGDTLWMADIDVLRGFDRRTGAPLAAIDFRPHHAMLLNDVTVGRDGLLYVTDTGIEMSPVGVLHPGGDRIFVVGPNHAVGVVARGNALGRPNGIIPAARGNDLTVVSFDPFRSQVYTVRPGDPRHALTVSFTGKGKFDGVEPLPGGRVLVSCWNDSSIHVVGPGSADEKIITGLSQPADIGVDTRRNRIAIPQVVRGRVEFWELPAEP